MIDLLIAFGIGTVVGAFGVLLWASCAIKKQKSGGMMIYEQGKENSDGKY